MTKIKPFEKELREVSKVDVITVPAWIKKAFDLKSGDRVRVILEKIDKEEAVSPTMGPKSSLITYITSITDLPEVEA